jgi:hypothetical protein
MMLNSFGLYRPRTVHDHGYAIKTAGLVGPIFARLLYDRAEITGDFIDTVVPQWPAALGSRYDHCE